jgi:hypothetical protein
MPERTVAVFAKAPVPGQVKTRLAAEIGARPAAILYRHMGRAVVHAVVGPGYRTVVWFAPPRARRGVRAWLAGLGVAEYRSQGAGDLGARLRRAFRRQFGVGDEAVVIIGTDCPELGRRDVARAFDALESHDVVLGPARDGGYYLVGLRSPQPALFREIPWSTPYVMRVTQARAIAVGLRCKVLRRLRDVDNAADARALGLFPPPDC